MNVAVIGSGGREHALAYKIKESKILNNLFIIPGNPGTDSLGKNVSLDISDKDSIVNFCKEKDIDLVVIGPEQPLVDGLADILRENKFKVFGPDSGAAEIEAKKSFAKKLMNDYNIPTAEYQEFDSTMFEQAKVYLENSDFPIVIKADGLAAGKGVLICKSYKEAIKALDSIFIDQIFGAAGKDIIIEDFLEGEEASVFAITDGENFVSLPPAQDHKRIGEGDRGKNTGGMGAYAPAPLVKNSLLIEIENNIIIPTLKALQELDRKFIGCLYCGLMITKEGPKVVEFNCRFGDPETQVIIPLLKGDFLMFLYSAAFGKLDKKQVLYEGGSSVCVVAASEGYPGSYEKGKEIKGLDNIISDDVIVFHAGTKKEGDKILTNGGRVLGVTSLIKEFDLKEAKEVAYNAIDKIHFEGIYYRRDIADKALI